MKATKKYTAREAKQAAPDIEFDGLHNIASALGDLIGYPIDQSTAHRWLSRGIRGHRLIGRRVGRRWICSEASLKAFALASGAIAPEDA